MLVAIKGQSCARHEDETRKCECTNCSPETREFPEPVPDQVHFCNAGTTTVYVHGYTNQDNRRNSKNRIMQKSMAQLKRLQYLSYASISTSKSIPSVYIQLFQRLHAEITENFDDCTPQLIFHFSTNGMYTNTDWFPLLQKRLLTTSMKRSNGYVTAIVTDMEANNATLMDSIEDPVRFRYHCSLVFIEIGTLLTKNTPSEGDNFNQEYFQENLLQLTRNVEKSFYIYFSSSEVDLIPSFLKVTAVTHRKIFVIPNEGKVNVLKQTPGIIDQVYLLQSFEQESFDISKEIFCNQWEDFQGRSLVIAACPICESS
ncbi:unnamed protein product, partial [Allacma fusca]